jgi:hypothetical protein
MYYVFGQVSGNEFAQFTGRRNGTMKPQKKRLAVATVTAIMLALSFTAAAPVHAAAQGGRPTDGITMPVTSAANSAVQFVGTFDLNRFVATPTGVNAVGTVSGILTDAAGTATTVVRNVSIPVVIDAAAATCDILHLELGPLDLDLLGLVVHLNQIVLDIDAQAGPGNLLGNLLCAVVGLLDDPSGLAGLLNKILDILG